MSEITKEMMQAARVRSQNNRKVLESGGRAGCYYCGEQFDAREVTVWWGEDNQTACCPVCSCSDVLSSKLDRIDSEFLEEMHTYFHWGDGVNEGA